MITDGKPFNTNVFFSGGAGIFMQYHDIVKPVYLYTIFKMVLIKKSFGLPLNIIQRMSILSLIEWYMKRRYINPLQCLDYRKILDTNELDELLWNILEADDSLYKLSPGLNIRLMMNVYKRQHMTFPVYVYSKREESHILKDCKQLFAGISVRYLYGDLKEAVAKCDQNFTYIFSDIELVKELCKILTGTCSHILLAREYRYNYSDDCKTFKYNLYDLAQSHPFVRIGTTLATDLNQLALSFNHILQGGEIVATN